MSSVYLETVCYRKIALYSPRLDLLLKLPPFAVPNNWQKMLGKVKIPEIAPYLRFKETYPLAYSLWQMWLKCETYNLSACRKQLHVICKILRENPPFITMLPSTLLQSIEICNRSLQKTTQQSAVLKLSNAHRFKCFVCAKEVRGNVCVFKQCKCSNYILHKECVFKQCPICDFPIRKS